MDEGAAARTDDGRPVVDGDGRRWTTSWARWATREQVGRLLRRRGDVVVRSPAGEERLDHDSALRWWEHARHHWAVPGREAAVPDDDGLTWAAHVWRCDDGLLPRRRTVVETHC